MHLREQSNGISVLDLSASFMPSNSLSAVGLSERTRINTWIKKLGKKYRKPRKFKKYATAMHRAKINGGRLMAMEIEDLREFGCSDNDAKRILIKARGYP